MRTLITGVTIAVALTLSSATAFAATGHGTGNSRSAAKTEARMQASRLCQIKHKEMREEKIRVEKKGSRYKAILTYRCV